MKKLTMMMAVLTVGTFSGCSSRPYTAESVIAAQQKYNARPAGEPAASTPSTAAPSVAPAPEQPAGQNYRALNSSHWVSTVLDLGNRVKLEDNSIWEVSPNDIVKTRLWTTASTIKVVNGVDPKYPYRLTNGDKNEMADARLIAQ